MEETELNMSVSSPSNTSNTAADQAADKPMTRPDNAHSTGVADSGRWSTKRIAMYALFVALSMAVSFIEFPIIPGVQWLKYDPSGIVCLVAGFAFGPAAAVIVSVLGFVPHLFTNPWGTLMAVLVALALSVPASLIYKKNKTRKGALIGIIVGGRGARRRHRRQHHRHAVLRAHDHRAGRGAYSAGAPAVQHVEVHHPRRGHVPDLQADLQPAEPLSFVCFPIEMNMEGPSASTGGFLRLVFPENSIQCW